MILDHYGILRIFIKRLKKLLEYVVFTIFVNENLRFIMRMRKNHRSMFPALYSFMLLIRVYQNHK